jgi:hypothetical protein
LFIIDDAFDYASHNTVRPGWGEEIPCFQPCKGWTSVAVLDEFASLAFRKVGEGYGSDSGKHGGMLNFTQGVLGQITPDLLERHAGIYIPVRGDG